MIKQTKNVDALKGHNSPVSNVRLKTLFEVYTHIHTHTNTQTHTTVTVFYLPGSLHCGGSLQLGNVQTHLCVCLRNH